jgi:hypothetical protein
MGDEQTQRCGRCKQLVQVGNFSPSYRGKAGTWCRPCFASYHRGEPAPNVQHEPRACAVCGNIYVPKHLKASAEFCSRRCKDLSRSRSPKRRDQRLRREYGITLADYEALLVKQKNRCAICRVEKPAGRWDVWHIDHCHDKGHVRGILCSSCNHGIGQFRDDPALLRRAADYLEAPVSA